MDGIGNFGLEMAGLLPTMETFQDWIPAMRFTMCCFLRAFSARVLHSAAHSSASFQAKLTSWLHVFLYGIEISIPSHSFSLSFFFLMWTIFKASVKLFAILFLFYILQYWPRGMWDLSSLTRDWTHTLWNGRLSPNPWTTKEVPYLLCHS